jgi:fumarylacetoacetate (FAA) hydrolase family protein
MLPYKNSSSGALLVGRVWVPDLGPVLVRVDGDEVVDITSTSLPTMQALLESDNLAQVIREAPAKSLCSLSVLTENSLREDRHEHIHLLAPPDLQAIKASGVTFAESMVERVIEEQAAGDADRAEAIRAKVKSVIGESLSGIEPGSEQAMQVKAVLQQEGLWSQYLEVGIGPDAEVFTKCQPMAAVGFGADVGIHPISTWNNPEPEIVLAVNSNAEIVGATLGNDVNLRDVEGRSALLLGKAKDNNASCAIGPFLRIFDANFTLDSIRRADLSMQVEGVDGFTLEGFSSMTKISRDPESIVKQTIGRHHQYPDGFFLFLGTMFAPVKDRDAPGQGFTHHGDDVVKITEANLGELQNRVRYSTECPEWTFGTSALFHNLAKRGLLQA